METLIFAALCLFACLVVFMAVLIQRHLEFPGESRGEVIVPYLFMAVIFFGVGLILNLVHPTLGYWTTGIVYAAWFFHGLACSIRSSLIRKRDRR